EENARVVDQNIEPSDFGLDKAADDVDRLRIRRVESMSNRAAADLRRRLGCRVASAAGDDDPNLARGELARHFASDPAARAGDEGDWHIASGQLRGRLHHRLLLRGVDLPFP